MLILENLYNSAISNRFHPLWRHSNSFPAFRREKFISIFDGKHENCVQRWKMQTQQKKEAKARNFSYLTWPPRETRKLFFYLCNILMAKKLLNNQMMLCNRVTNPPLHSSLAVLRIVAKTHFPRFPYRQSDTREDFMKPIYSPSPPCGMEQSQNLVNLCLFLVSIFLIKTSSTFLKPPKSRERT